MTIEERTNDPAAQHSRKRLLITFRLESRYHLVALRKAANVQALFVRRAATKANHVWRVGFLETLFAHLFRTKLKFEL